MYLIMFFLRRSSAQARILDQHTLFLIRKPYFTAHPQLSQIPLI